MEEEDNIQPVPKVTSEDVERIVRRDFTPDKYAEVTAMLSEYGMEEWQHGEARVRLAILKLAAGDIKQLRYWVDISKRDYRDVLAYAEYPGYMTKVPPLEEISAAGRQEIINQDWLQYQAWLQKK